VGGVIPATPIHSGKVKRLAAAKGINTVTELATRSGISRSVLNKALRFGEIRPRYGLYLAMLLDVEVEDLGRSEDDG
jgi:hypothetical protein